MKCITFSFYKSYYYFIIFWISSFLLSFLLSLYEKKLQKTQENIGNTRISDELFDLASQIGGDLFSGFLVLYTYITSQTLTVTETKNNLVDINIELIKSSKKMNRCVLIFIVSIFEFIYKSTNSILSIFYDKLQYGEYNFIIFNLKIKTG